MFVIVSYVTIRKESLRAESLLCKRTKEAVGQACEEFELLDTDPVSRRIAKAPFYPFVIGKLKSEDIPKDTPSLVEAQKILDGLNLLGDLLTRARKRDVQGNSAARSAYSIAPPLSAYEQYAYDTISDFVYEQDDILATPTVIRTFPPVLKLVGDIRHPGKGIGGSGLGLVCLNL